ncbi:MAG: HlyD family secretion protein [Candidatus Omnitrophica bacterium]|nr:HlyD family secretion protein [Candidatus Omnitrophota bacterium]
MHNKIVNKFNGMGRRSRLLTGIGVLGLCVLCYWAISYAGGRESTDDAFIDGHVISISPKVSGHVARVYVTENEMVKGGQLLFEIDSRDYLVRYDLAKADLRAAFAELKQASQDAARYEDLWAKNDISAQQYERSTLRVDTAQAKLDNATARLQQAEFDLSYTKIRAPEAGQVAQKAVEPGAYVQAGQTLLAIVPPERWITANFKETQMARIHPGEKVEFSVDAYPGKTFYGHVDSVQHGTGSRFSLLPVENATGNYIKVIQRVPVKIVFDENPNPETPLALGMSALPTIKTN